MTTTENPAGAARTAEPHGGKPARDEAARAREYLDLWERHVSQSSVGGQVLPGTRQPA